jgi:hypothetical protein
MILGAALGARAADEETKTSALTLHPLMSLAVQGIHVSWEGSLGRPGWAYEVPLLFGYNEYYDENAQLFLGAGLGIRRYPFAPSSGMYLCPQFEAGYIRRFAEGPWNEGTALLTVSSLRMGYKFQWRVFTLDLGMGMAFASSSQVSGFTDDTDWEFKALMPWGNLALGIPF